MARSNESQYARAMRAVRKERQEKAERGKGARGQVKALGGARCGATRSGGKGTCNMPAGMGTSHYGFGRCKHHGGLTPSSKLNSAKQEAVFMGAPKEINPVEALTWCIHITAGEVEWFSQRMAELEESDWYEHNVLGKQLNILGRERANAIVRLERFSKDAISLGIAERRVRIAEQYGAALAKLLRGVLDDLQLTPEQKERAPLIVRKHLILLEGKTGTPDVEGRAIPAKAAS